MESPCRAAPAAVCVIALERPQPPDRMTGKEVEKEYDPKDAEFLLAGRDDGEDFIS